MGSGSSKTNTQNDTPKYTGNTTKTDPKISDDQSNRNQNKAEDLKHVPADSGGSNGDTKVKQTGAPNSSPPKKDSIKSSPKDAVKDGKNSTTTDQKETRPSDKTREVKQKTKTSTEPEQMQEMKKQDKTLTEPEDIEKENKEDKHKQICSSNTGCVHNAGHIGDGTNINNSNRTNNETSHEISPPTDDDYLLSALRMANLLTTPASILQHATSNVTCLKLPRALPQHIDVFELLIKLTSLKELDISRNNIGPLGVRALCLAMCHNSTIQALNMADNNTDTDTAKAVGEMLKQNSTLRYLDVSGNYLGKDYFSRCVGEALATNTSLRVLRCGSIGSTDMTRLAECICGNSNTSIEELVLDNNSLTDATIFVQHLTDWMKSSTCLLQCIQLKNCNLRSADIELLTSTLHSNKSLRSITLSGSQVTNTGVLMSFVLSCICHPCIDTVHCEGFKPDSNTTWQPGEAQPTLSPSKLTSLSLINCDIKDEHLEILQKSLPAGCLSNLKSLNLNNNQQLSAKCVDSLKILTTVCPFTDSNTPSCLENINLGLNNMEQLPDTLASRPFPGLQQLNLTRAKCTAKSLSKLSSCLSEDGISKLLLSGIKLAGSGVLKELFANPNINLSSLTLGGCQLNDRDMEPLWQALGDGLPLRHLIMPNNRLTDTSLTSLMTKLCDNESAPLALLDMADNKVKGNNLDEVLSRYFSRSNVKLVAVNLSGNCVEPSNLEMLMKYVGDKKFLSLDVSNQQGHYEETDMDEVFKTLATTLEFRVEESDDDFAHSTTDLKQVWPGFSVRLSKFKGITGKLGEKMDCASIDTDFKSKKLPNLLTGDAFKLAAYLKGNKSPQFLTSQSDWSYLIDAEKGGPSWLMIPESRDLAILMIGLPTSITVNKLEGFLETEADCNVQEICLLKDIVSQQNNGMAWVLMSDKDSLTRAMDLYYRGEALIFGQYFTMSNIPVCIDDASSAKLEDTARKDMDRRRGERHKEEAAHRKLIQQSYTESQARHAYRLANPAYADGRIW